MLKNVTNNQYLYSLLSKFTITFFGLTSSVLISRSLGPSLKGEYAYILNIVNIAVVVLNLGIYQSYPYYRRKQLADINARYINNIFFQFLCYIAIALIMVFFIRQRVWAIISTLIPVMILSRQLNFIALVENIRIRNTINIIDQLFYTGLILAAYLCMPHNLYIIFAVLYVKEITAVALIIIIFKFKINLKYVDFKLLGETIAFGIYPMLAMLLTTLNYQVDVLILKAYVSFEQIGYYTIGAGLANQAWIIPDAFKDVLFAKTARDDAKKDIRFSLIINITISFVIFLAVIIYGRQAIKILYGEQFVEAYRVTTIIFAGTISMVIFKLLMPLYNAKGKQKLSFRILFISVAANIILNFILIPIYGINGAAFASVISYTVCGGAFLIYLKKIT